MYSWTRRIKGDLIRREDGEAPGGTFIRKAVEHNCQPPDYSRIFRGVNVEKYKLVEGDEWVCKSCGAVWGLYYAPLSDE